MQRLEVSGAVRPIYGSLGAKRLTSDALLDIFEETAQQAACVTHIQYGPGSCVSCKKKLKSDQIIFTIFWRLA
jgi:hypothetical protein